MTFTKTVASADDGNVQLVDLTDEEIAIFEANKKEWDDGANDRSLAALRLERNAKLASSDWTQSRDVTLSNDAEWKAYREALRRLPETTDPANPEWPKEPST
tara:strand:- start:3539 stop:3844 length:306 start_codon:yes stop_codon:yes gene_type:complete